MKKLPIDQAVDRFLCWRLPENFAPDCGISFVKVNHPTSWPTGTNLFTADQAKAMLAHVAEPLIVEIEQRWIPVIERLPDSGVTVLAFYKNGNGLGRRIRAQWIAAKSSESSDESDFGEYDESSDTYYDPEGWYEQIEHAVDYSAMFVSDGKPTHWMPLPAPPKDAL